MRVNYFAQPDVQFGQFLTDALEREPAPRRVVIVSAFAALQTMMRLKFRILSLREAGTTVTVVLGLDLGGTSKEVLQQVSTWNVNVIIVKNRIPGHTFHPKLYLLEWEDSATIIVGSNNLTEGGLFRNYESSASIHYDLPVDAAAYDVARRELRRFLQPQGPIAKPLTPRYLHALLARSDIPTEKQARERRTSELGRNATRQDDEVFGSESISPPPPLPAELLRRLIARIGVRRGRPRQRHARVAADVAVRGEQIYPAAFYMSLPTLQGPSIPGEARIPLAAVELAEEFWGWPDKYVQRESPRAGQHRVYHEWKPIWRIWDVRHPERAGEQSVRMYMYENSSDFRFYARPLVNAGADLGDVVRIVRVAEASAEFECALARAGTAEHHSWLAYCSVRVRNSTRRFGYG